LNVSDSETRVSHALGLRAEDWVEVRSAEEILATLDERGCLDALPFMPEMLQYCGRRFRVFKSAHKTCDTIERAVNRRMENAVHLEGLRCDGAAHGGCQAGCLLFWKEAWLKRASDDRSADKGTQAHRSGGASGSATARLDRQSLSKATRWAEAEPNAQVRYRCQATEMLRATATLPWWDPRPFLKDLTSRNVRLRDFLRFGAIAVFNRLMGLHWRGRPYPYLRGLAGKTTPTAPLNLQAGDLVRVRSKDEIMRTLNERLRNRGLIFDVEMVPYCDSRNFRVLRRVEKIINEKTGYMMNLPNPCVILDGVTCSGHLSRDRMFCPRSIYPYWHEVWLKRADQQEERSPATDAAGLGESRTPLN